MTKEPKTFIDELLEVNKRIPRRLQRSRNGDLVTAKHQIVKPEFYGTVDLIRIIGRKEDFVPYFFQLGRGEFRGARHVSAEQANLALGSDFETAYNEQDVEAMLTACDINSGSPHNAYVLGGSNHFEKEIIIPVAYLRIPPKIHKGLAIDPKKDPQFVGLIEHLYSKERGKAEAAL